VPVIHRGDQAAVWYEICNSFMVRKTYSTNIRKNHAQTGLCTFGYTGECALASALSSLADR